MSMLFGGGGAGNKLPTVHFLRVSDSQWGIVWPVLYGRARLPSHIIWIGDQRAVENTGPGKGLEGASGGGVFYTYYASLINAFCLGPVNGFGRAYNTGNGGLRRLSGPARSTCTSPLTAISWLSWWISRDAFLQPREASDSD